MTDSSLKQKGHPLDAARRRHGYRALVLAVTLGLALCLCVRATLNFPETFEDTLTYKNVLYLLVLITQTQPLSSYVTAAVGLSFIGLVIFAALRVKQRYVLLVACLGIAMFFYVEQPGQHQITPYHSLSHGAHVYRLVGDITRKTVIARPLVVLECDSLGLVCHYYGMAQQSDPYKADIRELVVDDEGRLLVRIEGHVFMDYSAGTLEVERP